MADTDTKNEAMPEVEAIGIVYGALKKIDPTAQLRVLRYCAEMLGLKEEIGAPQQRVSDRSEQQNESGTAATLSSDTPVSDDAEGINPVALRWVKRSSIELKSLQSLFSLGIDEIDLVANTIPGDNKKARLRNVLLLKGMAAYLGTGAARITYEQLKEAALHYSAFDNTNFAAHMKSMAADVGGSKEAGYTLTARGINEATTLIKGMLGNRA
jgi:hypothetical protein